MAQRCFTPPPPGSVRTPDTPRHGFSDNWEPFSPRKSARISEKRANARTPSPGPDARNSTRPAKTSSTTFSTPATSPQKRRMPAMDSVRRAPQGTASAADLLGAPSSFLSKAKSGSSSTTRGGMLATPAKTPRKQPTETETANVQSVARNLFASESDIMTPRKRKAKKYTGITLESFVAEEVEQPIAIFTDSRDRIPSIDRSNENPFYAKKAAPVEQTEPEPPRKRSKRRQVTIPGEGSESVEQAVRRDDGIVYVFRGKKIFRKFSDSPERAGSVDVEEEEMYLDALAEDEPPRRLTRSSIKPRLLFPPKAAEQPVVNEDEEADTDIEDNGPQIFIDAGDEGTTTPAEAAEPKLKTPKAPRFAPVSPPSTSRATRAGARLMADESPIKRPAKSGNPFDSWRVSKRTSGRSSLKREGDSLESSFESAKRQRT